ncbi:methyltransferase domain-containing protein [Pseudonocardia bannensis]|uniref:Histone-lysine N-methyltransferase, H3 lysine-79 specific n=1 Tax=Pseudonocardia bannensis TaxID=630973 RepID=A0A848DEV0_9PSEU|nr:methyltransferase domain-containing protein [Pseudonocardia bannensis]NMH91127.1 methyltransferase domain-containing protein [Pseudonocardia bannensis]
MIAHVFTKALKPPYVWAREAVIDIVFERRYGVKTSGEVSLEELGLHGKERRDYLPSGILTLRRMLPVKSVTPEDVFIDFGSGKGRVVLLAALGYPFRRVIGVEISERLHRIAQQNLQRNRDRLRCRDVELIHSDVLDFSIPDDVTIAFFYNPFGGRTFETIVDHLLASVDRNPRPLRIIYGNPVEESALLATGRVRQTGAVRGLRPGSEWARSNAFRIYAMN